MPNDNMFWVLIAPVLASRPFAVLRQVNESPAHEKLVQQRSEFSPRAPFR
jgi:hypothetical protein